MAITTSATAATIERPRFGGALSVGIDACAAARLPELCGGTLEISSGSDRPVVGGRPGLVPGSVRGDECEPVMLAAFAGGGVTGGRTPVPGAMAPSGSVAGGDDPELLVAGGGFDPTAAGGMTNARNFAVEGESTGGATGGIGDVCGEISVAAPARRCGGGRSVAFSAFAISAAVGARAGPSASDSVWLIAGNGGATGGADPLVASMTSVESSRSEGAAPSGAGAAGSWPMGRA